MASWALISGERQHNRADFLLDVIARLRAGGARVAGFAQQRRYDANGAKGYQLLRLATGETQTLAVGGVAARGVSQEAFCSFAFLNDAFGEARAWIEADAGSAQVLVLDDVSKLEVQGKGHAASLAWALKQAGKVVLISARASQLFYVIENFGLDDEPVAALELPVDDAARDEFVRAVLTAVDPR